MTTARRSHYQYHVAIDAKDIVQLRQSLSSHAHASRTPISSSAKPQVAFTFTGQGSHYIGLGQKLFKGVESFRRDISDFDGHVVSQGFLSFVGLIDGTITDLIDISPVVTQLAITCSQIAMARLWSCWGITPSAVIGHSLGEYAALHVAGLLSILNTILLVGRRAELLVSTCVVGSHGMLAVRTTLSSVEPVLSDIAVEIACINGPEELVFSGTIDKVERLNETLTSRGIKTTKLNVPYAFHSARVDPILDSFKSSIKSATFNNPQIPAISTLLGEVVTKPGVFGAEYLTRHCRESVNFLDGMTAALDNSTVDEKTVWIELGPHPVCTNMIKATIGKDTIAVPSLRRNEEPWKTVSPTLSSLFYTGVDIDWTEYHREFRHSHKVLSFPSYSFDDKVYWIDYKENWCLTKGEKSLEASPKPAFSTTSVHRIVQEIVNPTTALVIG
jgi:acyl transferase domain-containing protein